MPDHATAVLGALYFGVNLILFGLFVSLSRTRDPPPGTKWFTLAYGGNVAFIALAALGQLPGMQWLPPFSIAFGSAVYVLVLAACLRLVDYEFTLGRALALGFLTGAIGLVALAAGATLERVIVVQNVIGGVCFVLVAVLLFRAHFKQRPIKLWQMALPAGLIGLHYLDYPLVVADPVKLAWGRVIMELFFIWFAFATMVVIQRMEFFQRDRAEQKLQEVLAGLEATVAQRTEDLRHEIVIRNLAEQDALAAKAAAESANAAKSIFLSTISHEIRTPLNGLVGMLEILVRSPLDAEQRRMTGVMQGAANALKTLVTDVLDFAKIEAGRMELEATEFSLPDVVEEVASLMGPAARGKGIELALRLDPYLPRTVRGDSLRIRQVLTNLANNAIKFTDSNTTRRGKVSIHAERGAGEQVIFTVRDNGIGMAPEVVERVFQPFNQADTSITRRYGGTGLGLSICKALTELMGGKLSVESEAARGSTFTVLLTLPVVATVSPRMPQFAETPVFFLCVDDESIDVTDEEWEAWGIRVTKVNSLDALTQRLPLNAKGPIIIVVASNIAPEIRVQAPSFAGAQRRPLRWVWLLHGTESMPLIPSCWSRRVDVAPAIPSVVRDALGAAYEGELGTTTRRMNLVSPRIAAGHTVLVVDDAAVNRQVLGRMLEEYGAAVLYAQTGIEGLSIWRERSSSLILTDLQMPEMDGLCLAQTVRSQESIRGGRIPIVAVTADAGMDVERDCAAAGIDACLVKPFTMAELGEVLHRYLSAVPPSTATVATQQKYSTAASASTLVDLSYLESIFGADAAQRTHILSDFATALEATVQDLEYALERGGGKNLDLLAHNLKSAARTVGANEVAERSERLYQRLRVSKDFPADEARAVLELTRPVVRELRKAANPIAA